MKAIVTKKITLITCLVVTLIVLAIFTTVLTIWYVCYPVRTIFPWVSTEVKDALPYSATDVRHFGYDTWEDYFYILKAKITKKEFDEYRKKLVFVPLSEEMRKRANWSFIVLGYDNSDWWDPSPSLDETYYDPTTPDSQIRMMKYEKGYVYVLNWSD